MSNRKWFFNIAFLCSKIHLKHLGLQRSMFMRGAYKKLLLISAFLDIKLYVRSPGILCICFYSCLSNSMQYSKLSGLCYLCAFFPEWVSSKAVLSTLVKISSIISILETNKDTINIWLDNCLLNSVWRTQEFTYIDNWPFYPSYYYLIDPRWKGHPLLTD